MDIPPKPPEPLDLPRFATWMHARGLVPKDIAPIAGVGREQVRRYCLPFSDPMNVTPGSRVIEKLYAYTDGEIGPVDWYPARLRGDAEATNAEVSA